MSTTYITNNLIAGKVFTDQMAFDAGTYYYGEALELNSGTGRLKVLASGTVAGIYKGEESTTLAAGDYDEVITGGEVYEGGIVNGSNVALTFTDAIRVVFRQAGFQTKRV